MRNERTTDAHAVALRRRDEEVRVPSGIDDEALLGPATSDEIDEVGHRPDLELPKIEVAVRTVAHGPS